MRRPPGPEMRGAGPWRESAPASRSFAPLRRRTPAERPRVLRRRSPRRGNAAAPRPAPLRLAQTGAEARTPFRHGRAGPRAARDAGRCVTQSPAPPRSRPGTETRRSQVSGATRPASLGTGSRAGRPRPQHHCPTALRWRQVLRRRALGRGASKTQTQPEARPAATSALCPAPPVGPLALPPQPTDWGADVPWASACPWLFSALTCTQAGGVFRVISVSKL